MVEDLIKNFLYVMPGFVMAGAFYALTTKPKPSQFERVIQALVFTFIIQLLLKLTAEWHKFDESLTAFVFAVVFGIALAVLTNSNYLRKTFAGVGAAAIMPYPSEWQTILSEKVTYVTLHFNDGRRLNGWPKEWPEDSDCGHFYIMRPLWLQTDNDNPPIELPTVDGILVNTKDVRWVEFVKLEEKTDEA